MDCRETKKRLIELSNGVLAADNERSLRQHLKECPHCARLALAESLLTYDFEQVRGAEPNRPITIGKIREEIAVRDKQYRNTSLGVRIMRQISDTVYKRPRLSMSFAALFILLLASVLVPVRTDHPIGYEIAFAAPGNGLALNQSSLEKMLAALDIDDASIIVGEADSETEFRIAPLKDSAKVQKLVALLDSLGSRRVHGSMTRTETKNRTIWQLLFQDDQNKADISSRNTLSQKHAKSTNINVNEMFKEDFLLWIPDGDQSGDSLSGLLAEGRGEKTIMTMMGEKNHPDKCGWNQLLNNSIMHTETPDGKADTFNLTLIKDVRRLEKMGYNFVTMEFETPKQIPIPDMGPKLNGITPDPNSDKMAITFMIPQAYEVTLRILDERGGEICNLMDCTPVPCMPVGGIHHITWDGLDTKGDPVKPGKYLCRFTAGDYTETKEIELGR